MGYGLVVAVLAVVVAVAAAVRSTWSPCGLSMLSTITPFSERGRGHRYGVTASWFVAGSVLGGATLGAVAAGLAAAWRAVGLAGAGGGAGLWLVAGAGGVGAAVDTGVFGPLIPLWRRQVDDGWLSRYRGWAYGVGFGWQIGVGVATYIMTAAVFVTAVAAAATGRPLVAWAVCVGFGLVRGSAVWLTAAATTPGRLRDLHRRFERWGPPVRAAVIAVQGATAVVALGAGVWVAVGGSGSAGWWAVGGAGACVVAAVVGAVLGSAGVPPVVGRAVGPAGVGRGRRLLGARRRRTATTGLAAVAVTAIALSLAAGGCGSSGHRTAVGGGGSPGATTPGSSTSAPSTTVAGGPAGPTTVAGQVPTVPNCGGGAYKPQTLLIVCGTGTAMATGVAWGAWGPTAAAGAGTVHLQVAGHAAAGAARLVLDMVATGAVGPQFSRLTVIWTGPSPDGHARDTYRLAPGA